MARTRSPTIVAWLTIAMVALIAYGSLYPFNLKPSESTLRWWQALAHLSWARAGRGDHIANVLLYVPLGFCLGLWCDGFMRHRASVLLATICSATLSLSIEVAQVYISSRVPSLWDVTLNTVGACGGAFGGVAWRALSARLPKSMSSDSGGGNSDGDKGALLVLLLWFAARWVPFVPHFTLSKLKAALQPLFDPQVTVSATAYHLVWWMVIAQTIFALTNSARSVELLLLAIATLLVGRLFIEGLSFVPSELIALVLLLPILVLLHRLRGLPRRMLLLAAFATVFVYERLAPFSWSSSTGQFDLWPFLSWIDAGMPLHLQNLLAELFEFAALIWLLREAGLAIRLGVWLVPLAVLLLEILALWMPGRDGSLTSPVLALATALTMRYLMRSARRDEFTPQRVRSH